MPASWPEARRAAMIGKPHANKPDIDNLIKALLDAVFRDDAHVHTIHAEKVWGESGEIRVAALSD
jgi:Holliday junction resolvase RusA-like endonuclease